MSKKQTFVVLGLGIFGTSVCRTLFEFGHDVIAIDKDADLVSNVSRYCTQAVIANFTDKEQMIRVGAAEAECGIVCVGEQFESALLAILTLKEIGVPKIIAKANSERHAEIMERVGADQVVRPESEMGYKVARQLVSPNIVDVLELNDNYSITEIGIRKEWAGQTILQADLRRNYGINVLCIRKHDTNEMKVFLTPDTVLEDGDRIMVLGENAVLDTLRKL